MCFYRVPHSRPVGYPYPVIKKSPALILVIILVFSVTQSLTIASLWQSACRGFSRVNRLLPLPIYLHIASVKINLRSMYGYSVSNPPRSRPASGNPTPPPAGQNPGSEEGQPTLCTRQALVMAVVNIIPVIGTGYDTTMRWYY